MASQVPPGPPSRDVGLKQVSSAEWRMITVVNGVRTQEEKSNDPYFGVLPFPSGSYEETLNACVELFEDVHSRFGATAMQNLRLRAMIPKLFDVTGALVWAAVPRDKFHEVMNGLPPDRRIIGVFKARS